MPLGRPLGAIGPGPRAEYVRNSRSCNSYCRAASQPPAGWDFTGHAPPVAPPCQAQAWPPPNLRPKTHPGTFAPRPPGRTRRQPRLNTFGRRLDTLARKVDTSGPKVNTLTRKLDTSAANSEHLSTSSSARLPLGVSRQTRVKTPGLASPPSALSLSKSLPRVRRRVHHPPSTPPLALRKHLVYTGRTGLPAPSPEFSCPRASPACVPSSPPSLARQPGTASVALAPAGRRAGNLIAARPRHAPSPAAPWSPGASPPHPKIRPKLSLASPTPSGGRAGER